MHKHPRRYRPRVRPDLTFCPRDGQFAVCDRAGTAASALSLAGALVLTQCDGWHDREAIVAALDGRVPEVPDLPALQAFVYRALDQFARDGILV